MVSWPATARITMRYTRTLGDDMVNTFHVRNVGGGVPSFAQLGNWAQAFRDYLWDRAATTDDLRNYMANEVTLAEIMAVSMDPSNIGTYYLQAVNQTGNATQNPLPPQLAAVVSHRSAIASRAARGRTYIGGLTELSWVASSTAYPIVAPTTITALTASFTALDAALAALATPSALTIASQATAQTYDVISHRYPTKWYTQRRRA